jgi:hypothetical protein
MPRTRANQDGSAGNGALYEIDYVLEKLEGVVKHGGYWMARCPAHDDNRASLSIKMGTEQPVILHCHAHCPPQAIVEAIGLTLADISYAREDRIGGDWTPFGDAVATYDYTDPDGQLLFQVLRTAGKQFPQRVPDESAKSGWRWKLGDVRRVPYRLPKIVAAIAANQTIYIVEGEKDVHSLEGLGMTATTSPGGAGKWRDEYDEWFVGADVVIVADRDKPGRDHAADVQKHLQPVAKSVVIAEPADGCKDVSDHLAAGHTLEELVPQRARHLTFAVVDLEPATEHVEPPTLICGDLLYLGAVHTLSGPPDCGKTTLAVHWMLQAVRQHGSVLFLDEEGGRAIVAEKFQSLGARPGERIGYIQFPSRTWDAVDVAMLNDVVRERRPTIVAWDSSAAFLARAGLDENSAADVSGFFSRVLTPIARLHGAAVLVIDHDTKSGEPSRYARGSGSKLAATDVAFKIAPARPFSKGESGAATLVVTKDRRGWLHRSFDTAFIASANMLNLTVRITQTVPDVDNPDLAPAEQKILGVLAIEPRSIPEITDRVAQEHGHGLRRETVSKALNKLMRMGLADKLVTGQGHDLWKVP